MDRRVMIMCDTHASGIPADLADSYLVRVEPRPNGGALVLWTDLPDQARVFDDAASSAEFCRDSPLEMFVSRSCRWRVLRLPRLIGQSRPWLSRSTSRPSCAPWA